MRVVGLWAPVFLLMAFIFYQSSLPDPGLPPGGLSDKSAHFLVYGALGAAVIRAVAEGRARAMTIRRVIVAAAIATAYGATDEVHQVFVPGRTPEAADLVADAAGAVAGAALFACAALALGKRS